MKPTRPRPAPTVSARAVAPRRQALHWAAGAAGAVLALPWAAQAQLKSGDNPDGSPRWLQVRQAVWPGRSFEAAKPEELTLDAPARAEDAGVVPIGVSSGLPLEGPKRLQKLTLVIDNNPSPMAGSFVFGPRAGKAALETRVRIDEYTHVRAIAETADGRLLMTTRFVKASGGCSAPPGKDPAEALATLGRMRFRVEGSPAAGQPLLAQWMVSHPNHSGMAMDQLTRQFTPAHFVRQVEIDYAGQKVLSAEVDFSISENPNLRFWLRPDASGELSVSITDSQDKQFQGRWPVPGA